MDFSPFASLLYLVSRRLRLLSMQQGSDMLLAYCLPRENPGDDDEEEEEVEEPSSSSEDEDGERGDDKEEADRRAGERPALGALGGAGGGGSPGTAAWEGRELCCAVSRSDIS